MSEIEKIQENQEQVEQVEQDKTKQNPKRKRKWLKGCLPGLIVLVLFWWFCLHSQPLRISPEITYVTSPKTADGKYIDYFRAMEERYYPPEMKTDNNGYRLIVRAFGDLVERIKQTTDPKTGETKLNDTESLRRQVYEKLGLDPEIKPTLKIESADTFLRRKEKAEVNVDVNLADKKLPDEKLTDDKLAVKKLSDKFTAKKGYWTIDEFPELKEWLDANNAGIDLIGEAVRKPAFRLPLIRENEKVPIINVIVAYGGFSVLRDFARAVRNRADYRIGVGDIDGAIYDVVTLHYLGYHTSKQWSLVGSLTGIAISSVASSTAIGANPNHPLTKEQLERWLKELNALPPKNTFAEALESERLVSLAVVQDLYRGAFAITVGDLTSTNSKMKIWSGTWRWSVDINIMLGDINKNYDLFSTNDYVTEPLGTITRNPLAYIPIRSRTKQINKVLMSLLVDSIQATNFAHQRNECTGNMQRLTLALLIYEKEHGKLPDNNWQDAIRPYLGGNPDKLFHCPTSGLSERDAAYQLVKDDKNFILLEAGVQIDDSKSPRSIKITSKKHGNNNGTNFALKNGAVRFISLTELNNGTF